MLDPDALFKEYDKDKSILLSADEIARVVKSHLDVKMLPPEIEELKDWMNANFQRHEIKRAELIELLTVQYDAEYDSTQVRHIVDKLEQWCKANKNSKYAKVENPIEAYLQSFF